MANEASEPLLQGEDRERNLIFAERRTAAGVDRLDACRRDWIARRRERQLVDDHATERIADDVDALPEARGREQHRMRRRLELAEQSGPRRRSLNENRKIELGGRDDESVEDLRSW